MTPVDFSWYSGFHPFGYSLLSPWLMGTFGIAPCALIAATGSAVLFARLTRHADRPWLTALSGAFFWAADIASGRVTFALGALAALAALTALPRRRWAVPFAVLSGLLSPVAAAFLGLVAAVLVLCRRPGGWTIGIATTAPVIALSLSFPEGGIQPMSPGSAVPGVLVALGLAAFTGEPLVRTGSLLYAVAVVFFTVHVDPFGSNVLRLGLLVAIPLLLATTGRRNAVLVSLVSMSFLVWQLDPLLGDLDSPPPVPFVALDKHLADVGARRIEVLAGRDHRESSDMVSTVALARGWARQIDVRDNQLFYRPVPLQAADYVAWLRLHAVDRVVVPRRGPLDFGSLREAALLRQPVPGLTPEWSNLNWVVYRLDAPEPIVSAPAELLSYDRTTLVIRSDRVAEVAVNLRSSRWLSVAGPACVQRSGGSVRLRFHAAGTARLTSSLFPHGHC